MSEQLPVQLRLVWAYGEKKELARRCNISPQYLSDILAGRKRALPELALEVERHSKHMELHITRDDVMYPEKSANPLIQTVDQSEGVNPTERE